MRKRSPPSMLGTIGPAPPVTPSLRIHTRARTHRHTSDRLVLPPPPIPFHSHRLSLLSTLGRDPRSQLLLSWDGISRAHAWIDYTVSSLPLFRRPSLPLDLSALLPFSAAFLTPPPPHIGTERALRAGVQRGRKWDFPQRPPRDPDCTERGGRDRVWSRARRPIRYRAAPLRAGVRVRLCTAAAAAAQYW
eukprot:2795565-Rhodomonas_salina.2